LRHLVATSVPESKFPNTSTVSGGPPAVEKINVAEKISPAGSKKQQGKK
jgi:hypothetical protein